MLKIPFRYSGSQVLLIVRHMQWTVSVSMMLEYIFDPTFSLRW
jgi:hypothetical protein